MTRIRLAEREEMTEEVANMCDQVEQLTGDSTALRALAHRPDILKPFSQFYWALQTEGRLSRKMVELIRLAVAQINQCKSCLGGRYQDAYDQGLTEAMVNALPQAETSELFTDAERAAIAYAPENGQQPFRCRRRRLCPLVSPLQRGGRRRDLHGCRPVHRRWTHVRGD